MKRKLSFILFIALLTCSGIISFQFFWMYSAYKVNEDNFNKNASIILQRSIDDYQLQHAGISSSIISATEVSISTVDSSGNCGPCLELKKKQIEAVKKKAMEALNKRIEEGQVQQKHINADNMDKDMLFLLSRLISKSRNQTVNLEVLQKKYRKELAKSNIDVDFSLSFVRASKKAEKAQVVGQVGFSENNTMIQGSFINRGRYLLLQTLSPILISLVLILLTAGSLWYMLYVILRQKKLDNIKNDFINNMTHELRTPIAILKSTHEALDKFGEVTDLEKTQRYLKMNITVLDKLENSVERILDINEYEKQERVARLENVNLKRLVQEVINRFSLNEGSSITYEYRLSNEEVITEAYAMDTIISNLIDNAVKYAKNEQAKILVRIFPLGDGWQLQVADNGYGIQSRHLPFIFDKFYRVPMGNLHNVKGYGLGLNYVKVLVQLLKGEISIESKPDVGTTFTIKF
ncbi:sensor histidine kinase [Pedobacter caeni]|uniref:histidine kinase n=1 Tax=Pedobacter caeni TaxID=288992 RepID=A0A1M5BNU8_9SPHI|nr:HAMP domain-containing sensor histidine kinase [Pedobacter caeni]SHF43882.1 His Kinase A (phospho-acceptor) domain-containing protein [Pedobacter caeni]